jgi:hypothetical protein
MGLQGKPRNEPFTPGTVVFDFDGVIHSYVSGWTGWVPTDPPVPGVIQFLNELIAMGYKPVIMSSRAQKEEGVRGIELYLKKYGVDTDKVRITFEKVGAAIYIDDRGFRFNGDVKELREFFFAQEAQSFPTWVAPPWKD